MADAQRGILPEKPAIDFGSNRFAISSSSDTNFAYLHIEISLIYIWLLYKNHDKIYHGFCYGRSIIAARSKISLLKKCLAIIFGLKILFPSMKFEMNLFNKNVNHSIWFYYNRIISALKNHIRSLKEIKRYLILLQLPIYVIKFLKFYGN